MWWTWFWFASHALFVAPVAVAVAICDNIIAPTAVQMAPLVDDCVGSDSPDIFGGSLLHIWPVDRKQKAHLQADAKFASLVNARAATSSFAQRVKRALQMRSPPTIMVVLFFATVLLATVMCFGVISNYAVAQQKTAHSTVSSLENATRAPCTATVAKQILSVYRPRYAGLGGSSLRLVGQIKSRRPQDSMLEVEQACHHRRADVVFRFFLTEGTASAGVMLEDALTRDPIALLDTRAAVREEGLDGERFVQVFFHASARPAAHLVLEKDSLGHVVIRPARGQSTAPSSTVAVKGSAVDVSTKQSNGLEVATPPLCKVRFAKEGEHAIIFGPDTMLMAAMQSTPPVPSDLKSRPYVSSLKIAQGLDEVFIVCVLVAAMKMM